MYFLTLFSELFKKMSKRVCRNFLIKCKVLTNFKFYTDYFKTWENFQNYPTTTKLKIRSKQCLLVINAITLIPYLFYQSKWSHMINLITCNSIYLNSLHAYVNAWLIFITVLSYVFLDLIYLRNFNISSEWLYQLLIKQNNHACFLWPYICNPKKFYVRKRVNPQYQPKTIAVKIKEVAISVRSQYQILYFISGKNM